MNINNESAKSQFNEIFKRSKENKFKTVKLDSSVSEKIFIEEEDKRIKKNRMKSDLELISIPFFKNE